MRKNRAPDEVVDQQRRLIAAILDVAAGMDTTEACARHLVGPDELYGAIVDHWRILIASQRRYSNE